jgi:hypothetical protein
MGLKDKISEISEGWKNLVFEDKLVEAEAKRRAEICGGCPKFEKKLGVPVCGACGCALAAKTRSMSSECPEDKW